MVKFGCFNKSKNNFFMAWKSMQKKDSKHYSMRNIFVALIYKDACLTHNGTIKSFFGK